MNTLRARVVAALVVTVVLAVAGAAVLSVQQVTARLEAEVASQGARAMRSLEAELVQAAEVLDGELRTVLDEGSVGGSAARYLWAKGRIEPGRVEVLKVLDRRGAILTSGHWPASVGFLDPRASLYSGPSDARPRLVMEPVPTGDAPSLQRWAAGRWAGRDVVAVVGRSLDAEALERVRTRLGVEALSLCVEPPCRGQGTALSEHVVGLGPDPAGPSLVIGVDRTRIDQLARGLRFRAALLALGGALLVIIPGGLFAARLTRPIEALARQAASLAQGDFEARVEAAPGVEEVDALVLAFNHMAEDIDRGRTRLVQAERVAAWREIARGLAHELRNPLTPILGAMDVLRRAHALRRDDFDEILTEQASAVVDEVMRLKELSDSFARFARLPDPTPESLDAAALLDGLVALYAASPDVTVRRTWHDPPTVWADATQLRTALSNLVKNGVEAMEGRGTLTLGIESLPAGVVISIEDDGPGIPPEIRDRLFTPYFTTKGSRGTGLGLALVHRIVMEHGGGVAVDDSPGGGARFRVTLPRRPSKPAAPAPPGNAPETAESPPPTESE